MSRNLLAFAFIFFSCYAYGQIEEVRSLLKKKPKSEETATWLCDTAFSLNRKDPHLAQAVAELALEKATKWQYDIAIAKANHVLGVTYWTRDDYTESLKYYLEALKYYEKVDNIRGMSIINMNIGIIYDDLEQSERAIKYYRDSERHFRTNGDSVNLGRVLNNLAVSLKRTYQFDSAIFYYKQTLKLRIAMGDSVNIASTYNNIGNFYLERSLDMRYDNAELAYENTLKALEYVDPQPSNRMFVLIQLNLSRALIYLGKFEESRSFLEQALAASIANNFKILEQWSYLYYYEMYSEMGDYKMALDYYIKSMEMDKELRSAEVNKQIDELNIKYETAKKEQKVAELERQQAVDRGVRNMLITGVVGVVIIALLMVLYSYQKRRKDKMIAELQFQKMSDEITSKNKEIASYTMSFLQKNQLMEELKSQINELKKSSDISTNKELTRINRIVDNTFRSDEEWKTFQITFDQMHDGFFADLKEAFPDISNAELKLCALLRLNMNLKESAKILGIAPDSVKTARYRLRKKLGLKTEDNLIDFLIQFEKAAK